MIIKTSGKESNFKPDPVLDTERDYEGRVVGIFHKGIHEKDKWENDKKVGVVEEDQVTLLIELVEEDTYVERGEGADMKLVPRQPALLTLKYSSHVKSNMYATAKLINPASVWEENKQGVVDLSKILGEPVAVSYQEPTEEGKQYIDKKLKAIASKYRSKVEPAKGKQFCYSVMGGEYVGSISDIPTWLLQSAIDKAVNVDEFEQLEAIEDHLAKMKAQKEEGASLEGDESPAKKSKKAEDTNKEDKPKQTSAKKEEAADAEVPEEKVAVDEPKSRSRRSAKKEEDSGIDYSTMSIGELEDMLLEKGLGDSDLDEISDNATSDEGYQEDLIKKLKSM